MIARITRHVVTLTVIGSAIFRMRGQAARRKPRARSKPEPPPQPPAGAVVTAETTTVDLPLTLPSQLYVEHDAAVLARSSGMVQAILADIGAR